MTATDSPLVDQRVDLTEIDLTDGTATAAAPTPHDDRPRRQRTLGRSDLFEAAVAASSGISLAIVASVVMD